MPSKEARTRPSFYSGDATIKSYLQLFRVPNQFTAIADITAGYLLAHSSLKPHSTYVGLLICSCLLYSAGLVLNDVYDVDQDRRERPQRPLPSGRISVTFAKRLGYTLLVAGIVVGWFCGYWLSESAAMAWRSGTLATLLAAFVLGYNRLWKSTFFGPLAMGACRLLNILLGVSLAPIEVANGPAIAAFFEPSQLVAATGMGTYILGVTLFAQTEAQESNRWRLFAASSVIVIGMGLIGIHPAWLPVESLSEHASRIPLLVTVLAVLIGWRCLRCAVDPAPRNVQRAVKVCLMSIIVLDAVIALSVADYKYAVGILALLIPTIVFARWISPT